MERTEEFVDKFKKGPQKASHLLSVREWFRKLKIYGVAGGVFTYLLLLIPAGLELEFSRQTVEYFGLGFTLMISLWMLVMFILFVDLYRYKYNTEDLASHEFAQAVDAYYSNPPNYTKWRTHLENAHLLLDRHNAEIFSKHRKWEVLSYLRKVKHSDANEGSKSHFEEFFNSILVDILDEYDSDFKDTLEEIDTDQGTTSGLAQTLSRSIGNIINILTVKSWIPVVFILVIGVVMYLYLSKELGTFFTIALLSAVGVLRGEEE